MRLTSYVSAISLPAIRFFQYRIDQAKYLSDHPHHSFSYDELQWPGFRIFAAEARRSLQVFCLLNQTAPIIGT
jgi:hypothetical protein